MVLRVYSIEKGELQYAVCSLTEDAALRMLPPKPWRCRGTVISNLGDQLDLLPVWRQPDRLFVRKMGTNDWSLPGLKSICIATATADNSSIGFTALPEKS